MALPNVQILSSPMPVIFAGFRSDTRTLQQAGWRLAVEEDALTGLVRLMMHHPGAEIYMVARDWRSAARNLFQSASFTHDFQADTPEFVIEYVAKSLHSVRVNLDFSRFRDIDAEPQFAPECRNIREFSLFANPLVRTEEIIVEPQSVAECLELIRKMQAPDLARVRENNRRREAAINRQTFHAQIISLAA